ncbi:hypothetical protein IV38_GL001965 [Lactobacillus selangorensis]|uniref:Uncharacterized protein n=1 Tax=Lactobacillus selangorensis TaxID=81857 RepID=A0A0R2FQV2_9LACO|nr:prophage endopeptidase tail family protein [Lactobacillus selangorensis]KRN27751.1 hypothetical protein IV38_GL001965 [Lactobacillus selangorensis]KRN30284.1 hypothetical protein IV40_GL001872 [Lactobacillus selangorensis]
MYTRDKILVQDRKGQYTEVLTGVDWSSVTVSWEKNASYTLSFNAYDDGSMAFGLLVPGCYIWCQDEEYVMGQTSYDDNGSVRMLTVTATQYMYESSHYYQRDIKSGTQSYSLDDALKFLFDKNEGDFSYRIVGDFEEKELTDFGNCSIQDGIATIVATFDNVVVYPVAHRIDFYSHDKWVVKKDEALRYMNNTDEMTVDWDLSSLVNRVRAVGTPVSTDIVGIQSVYGGIGTISTTNDTVPTWNSPYSDQAKTGKTLKNGTNWKISRQATGVGSNTWYDLGANDWVDGQFIAFDKDGDAEPSAETVEKVNGIGTVKLDDGAKPIPVYNTYPPNNQATGQTLANATSWKISAQVTYQGKTWYQVGGGQWVDGSSFDFSSPTDVEPAGLEDGQNTYFDSFIVEDTKSIAQWGIHDGADVSNAQMTTADTMRQYVLSTMQSNPMTTITINYRGTDKIRPGDERYLQNYVAGYSQWVETTSITWYPFDASQPTQVTLNSEKQDILDLDVAERKQTLNALIGVENGVGQTTNSFTALSNQFNSSWSQKEVDAYYEN